MKRTVGFNLNCFNRSNSDGPVFRVNEPSTTTCCRRSYPGQLPKHGQIVYRRCSHRQSAMSAKHACAGSNHTNPCYRDTSTTPTRTSINRSCCKTIGGTLLVQSAVPLFMNLTHLCSFAEVAVTALTCTLQYHSWKRTALAASVADQASPEEVGHANVPMVDLPPCLDRNRIMSSAGTCCAVDQLKNL